MQFKRALKLLEEMTTEGVMRTARTYNALIASCKRDGQWQQAIRIMEAMVADGIDPDTFTFSSAISVCVESKQWPLALELLQVMLLRIPRNLLSVHFCTPSYHSLAHKNAQHALQRTH